MAGLPWGPCICISPPPPSLGSYLANNGAAFAESVLRVVFGYEPSWLAGTDPAGPTLANATRGVSGTLSCVRGPSGAYLTATLTNTGVDYAWSPTCGA